MGYHKKDVYTVSQLIEVANENEFINASRIVPGEMRNFLKWQEEHYRSPVSGDFNRTHVFEMSGQHGQKPTMLMKRDDYNAECRLDDLLPTRRNKKARYLEPGERREGIANMITDLEIIKGSGLKPLKMVELYTKWGPLLPDNVRHITCPKPPDHIIELVKKERQLKRKKKTT